MACAKTLSRMLAAVLMACALAVSAFAAPAFAAPSDSATTYTVRVYAGNRGSLDYHGGAPAGVQVRTDGAGKWIEWSGVPYGSRLDLSGVTVSIDAEEGKYYAKTVRLAGLDNVRDVYSDDQAATPQIALITTNGSFVENRGVGGWPVVVEDTDYVVGYGVLADRAAYTVRYLDADGVAVAPEKSFFGDVGDVPAAAAEYVEGYVPTAYTLTKTLSSNDADNVFEFRYTRVADGYTTEVQPDGTVTVITPTGAAATAAGAAGAGGAAAGGAGAGAPLVADDGTAVIDEDGNPLAAPEGEVSLDDNETPLASGVEAPVNAASLEVSPLSVACGLMALVCAVGSVALLVRSRKRSMDR